jgi:hypothetical protein
MTTVTTLQKAGYSGIKITSMIKAIESQEIFKHLRLVQQNEFSKLKNIYNKNGYLAQPYMTYLWQLYWNFVLNDFRFDDKSKNWSIPVKTRKIEVQEHIGIQMLNKLKCDCGEKQYCIPSDCSLNN